MFTRFEDTNKTVAGMETEKELMAKSSAERFSSARWKGAKSFRMGNSFIETISPMHLRLALRAKKDNVPYCCKEVFELFLFL